MRARSAGGRGGTSDGGIVEKGVGEFQGEGAGVHEAGILTPYSEGDGERGQGVFVFNRLEAEPGLQFLATDHLGAQIYQNLVGQRQMWCPDFVLHHLTMPESWF